jgi:hypothetical protein
VQGAEVLGSHVCEAADRCSKAVSGHLLLGAQSGQLLINRTQHPNWTERWAGAWR